jgi:hypothetical protein
VFSAVTKFVEETTANYDDIIYFLLQSMLERRPEIVEQYLPVVVADIIQTKWYLEGGVSKFVQELSDNTTDAPLTPTWFFKLVVKPMLAANRLNLQKVKWLQPEDDIFAVGGHIQLIALLIAYRKETMGDEAKALD